MEEKIITSVDNDLVKQTAALKQTKYCISYAKYMVEGERAIAQIPADTKIEYIVVEKGREREYAHLLNRAFVVIVTKKVMQKISDTVTCQGIIAVLLMPDTKPLSLDSSLVVLDNVSDVGNMGTIIRTAAALDIKDIVLINNCTYPYSAKCVRASMGGIHFVNLVYASVETVLSLRDSGYTLTVADAGGASIDNADKSLKRALIFGNEAHGVCDELKNAADETISIPISKVESLNVGVAAGIIMHQLGRK